jgi:DNA mismatch repair protein MutS
MPSNPNAETLSPAMRQFVAAKQAHPDALLFFRMGDFYELFFDDAVIASRELQLTLTARDKARAVPMCGVPYHAAGNYLQRLLRKGFRVAICEQMEDPKFAKGVVKREVTRVLTPGTALDATLAPADSQWLAAIAAQGSGPDPAKACVGVASIDLSTGDFRATEFTGPEAWPLALDELARIAPAELLSARGLTPTPRQAHLSTTDSGAPGPDSRSHDSTGAPGPDSRTRDSQDAGPTPTSTLISGAKSELDDWVFAPDYAIPLLQTQLRVHNLDGMGLSTHTAAAVAAGAIVHYLRQTKQGQLAHLDTLRFYEQHDCLELDAVSVRNLELVDPLFTAEGPGTTLFHTLDTCLTPMGKRALRAQLLRPMQSLEAINARLDAVALAAADLRRREPLRRALDGILDLERLLGRIALDSAGPRDLATLAHTLAKLPTLLTATAALAPHENLSSPETEHSADEAETPASAHAHSPGAPTPFLSSRSEAEGPAFASAHPPGNPNPSRWSHLHSSLDPLADLHELITRTLIDDPPLTLADGNLIRPGLDPELDDLRSLSSTGKQHIAAIEDRERTRTGIASLKVRFNSVFGYYIEITRANSKAVPADYERKQTLVNAERFTTPELKDLELKILTAQDRSQDIERRLFAELRRQVLLAAARLRATARHIAEIDLLASFAHTAALRGWTRPTVNASGALELIAARHPVIERRLEETAAGRFIPNSLHLCSAENPAVNPAATNLSSRPERSEAERPASAHDNPSLLLITGPNMGGKSTYLRTAALLTIMAQCGSFVPADSMTLGLVDRVYTRIGASDNVARGRSTFMVEMTETAAILNTATSRSLVLLDEMGRGTATYDGLSLAWAAVEHLHDRIGCRTLFATHYHELTLLADRLPHLRNLRVTVRETPTGIVFLHTVEPGAASKSYGIEVARLAGLPAAVIARAREVLRLHERAEKSQLQQASPDTTPQLQLTMFTPLSQRIVDRLDSLDIDGLTPREALTLLADLQRELKAGPA